MNSIQKEDRSHVLQSMAKALGSTILTKLIYEENGDLSAMKREEEHAVKIEGQLRTLIRIYRSLEDIDDHTASIAFKIETRHDKET